MRTIDGKKFEHLNLKSYILMLVMSLLDKQISNIMDSKSKWKEICNIGIFHRKLSISCQNFDMNNLNDKFVNISVPFPIG